MFLRTVQQKTFVFPVAVVTVVMRQKALQKQLSVLKEHAKKMLYDILVMET
jgi:hypothetical protein